MHVCICACMYVCVCVCMYICTYVCMYVCIPRPSLIYLISPVLIPHLEWLRLAPSIEPDRTMKSFVFWDITRRFVSVDSQVTFRRDTSPLSSRLENKANKKPAWSRLAEWSSPVHNSSCLSFQSRQHILQKSALTYRISINVKRRHIFPSRKPGEKSLFLFSTN
jgi:hypothetical protein